MKGRGISFLLTILTVSIVLSAQTPQSDNTKATIEGTVTRAGSGQPLKRARVSLRPVGQSQPGTGVPPGAAARAAESVAASGPFGQRIMQQLEQRIQSAAVNTQAVTDDSGRFRFNAVEPGQYRIMVEREGYVGQEFGQRSFNGPGTIINVVPGQNLTKIDFQLIPAGSISGRVFNEDGEPIANVQVQAQRYTYQQGKRVLMPAGQGSLTNDLGEFRMFWLAPGEYYITASARRGQLMNVNPVVIQQSNAQRGNPAGVRGGRGAPNVTGAGTPAATPNEEMYAPTYFPGTPNVESATPIPLTAATEVRGIDFGLRPTPTVSVRGQVLVPVSTDQASAPQPFGPGVRGGLRGGPGRSQINVQLTRVGAGRFVGVSGGMNRTNVRPDGVFEIAGVVPGSYTLTAIARQEGQQLSHRMRLEVGDTGMDNLTIALRAGIAVPGKIFLDGTPPPNFRMNQLRVNLQPAEEFQGGVGPAGNSQVTEDGSFILPNVPAMEYRVRVAGLPQGAYLIAGRIGNKEALNEPFSITGEPGGTLQLQIGFSAGQVRGTALDGRGMPYQGALITLIPDDPRRQRTELFFSTPTDQLGRFSFVTVPPGGYKLFAWEEIPNGAYMDPEFIRQYEDRGRVVKVDAGAAVDAQAPVIPLN